MKAEEINPGGRKLDFNHTCGHNTKLGIQHHAWIRNEIVQSQRNTKTKHREKNITCETQCSHHQTLHQKEERAEEEEEEEEFSLLVLRKRSHLSICLVAL